VPRRNSLIFAVHMWNPMGPEPETIWEVLHRQKDIQYSSRVASHIARQRQVHKLRHVVSELVKYIPEARRNEPALRDLAEYGCLTRMHVVRLLAPRLDNENHTKDIDFSPTGIRLRWEAGYADTVRALERAPWQDDSDPLEGVILHDPTV
jgi:NTE family protein